MTLSPAVVLLPTFGRGETPLHWATYPSVTADPAHSRRCCELLIRSGADATARAPQPVSAAPPAPLCSGPSRSPLPSARVPSRRLGTFTGGRHSSQGKARTEAFAGPSPDDSCRGAELLGYRGPPCAVVPIKNS